MKRNSPTDVWKKVDIKDVDDCWNWTGATTSVKLPYGTFGTGGKSYVAHRVVYLLSNPGSITLRAPTDKSKKEFVLHKCDNRLCCNPKHLFLGNYDDNNKDAMHKGRTGGWIGVRGPAHHLAVLSEEQVRQIRYLGSLNLSAGEVSKAFEISNELARRVIKGISYSGVPSGF